MSMFKNLLIVILSVFLLLFFVIITHKEEPVNIKLEQLKIDQAIKPAASVHHSKLKPLQKEFNSPQEVTEACLTCHTERHKEVMASSHWNWERVSYVEGRGLESIGKKNILNNFCIGAQTNEQSCAKCHIGFGMSDDHFDFQNARNVDCMVCHDNSEEYLKGSAMAGYPDRSVNLTNVAQSVGKPGKSNCGACHFYSGGGNNVKHGDLEDALLSTSRDVDVHMAANGMDMECVACHTAENHQIKGKLYSVSSGNTDRSTCTQCHTSTPHHDDLLNRHFGKIACQTCHIPYYAKENATKMSWKWSDAGNLKEGQPFHLDDSLGNHSYLSIKGTFEWRKNVKPEYIWFNGTAGHYILGDVIDTIPVQMNTLFGWHDDPNSKIIPVKVHRGDQIYDSKRNILIQPKLYSAEKGDSAFWMDFDWNKAAAAGMKRIGMEYSGEYGFVNTEMYWPVNHMVSPKSETVSCAECHTRNDGRLANLKGFYVPGRDHNATLDKLSILVLLLSIGGIIIHATARVITALKKEDVPTQIIDYEDIDIEKS